MFRIRLIKDLRTPWGGWIRKGEELDARILPGGMPFDIGRPFQVIAGKFSGVEVPQTHAITVPKEKLYTENQYNELRNAWIKAANESDELKQKLEELQAAYSAAAEEKQLWQEEFKELIAGKKVTLPYEVAEEIKQVQQALHDYSIVEAVFKRNSRMPKLSAFIDEDPPKNFKTFIAALVNGYNVNDTPQERIKRGVQAIYEKWTTIQSSGDDREDGTDLAERITKFVTEELKL